MLGTLSMRSQHLAYGSVILEQNDSFYFTELYFIAFRNTDVRYTEVGFI